VLKLSKSVPEQGPTRYLHLSMLSTERVFNFEFYFIFKFAHSV
jgi:hypothetical protein